MANIYDLSDTWNDGATTFTSIKINVTDTASAAASLLMDLQVGGTSQFKVSKAGAVTALGNVTASTFSVGGSFLNASTLRIGNSNGELTLTATIISAQNGFRASNGAAIAAGGTVDQGLFVSATPGFGIYFGSGAPTITAIKGSMYLRSDGSGPGDRAYINTDGSTTWTAIVTVA